jgi:hypothetical protein
MNFSKSSWLITPLLLGLMQGPLRGTETPPLPIVPQELALLKKIAQHEGLNEEPKQVNQGWPLKKGEQGIRFAAPERPSHALTIVCDADGHVVKYLGNGPLLSNTSCKWAAGLPKLSVIRIDHNIPGSGSTANKKDYDGSGFVHLQKLPIVELRIGHAFDDQGVAQLAGFRSLKKLELCHSPVTDAGLRALKAHPTLEDFTISSQARPERITEQCLATLTTLPKLKRLSLQETFLTYEGGLKLLKAKPLEALSLKGTLVLPEDLKLLQADHPQVTIEISTPAEILAAPNSRGVARWASPAAQKYLQQTKP